MKPPRKVVLWYMFPQREQFFFITAPPETVDGDSCTLKVNVSVDDTSGGEFNQYRTFSDVGFKLFYVIIQSFFAKGENHVYQL